MRAVLGAATPKYSLAVWHGFTPELLMSVMAMAGGVALYFMLHGYLLSGVEGPPLLRHLKGRRIFDARPRPVLAAREMAGGSSRNAPSPAAIAAAGGRGALRGSRTALRGRVGAQAARGRPSADLAFALVWAVGTACALGAAYQAKFHRLAALILLGGAGLVTCITFIWLSAPDLALTQLAVETVTTVLLLLGLRWLPKRIEESGALGVLDQGAAAASRACDFAIAVCVRRRAWRSSPMRR